MFLSQVIHARFAAERLKAFTEGARAGKDGIAASVMPFCSSSCVLEWRSNFPGLCLRRSHRTAAEFSSICRGGAWGVGSLSCLHGK